MGTGWLIEDDLVVTAGHVAYDWQNILGGLISATIYLGYSSEKSVGNPGVEKRMGIRVVCLSAWITSGGDCRRDVAMGCSC